LDDACVVPTVFAGTGLVAGFVLAAGFVALAALDDACVVPAALALTWGTGFPAFAGTGDFAGAFVGAGLALDDACVVPAALAAALVLVPGFPAVFGAFFVGFFNGVLAFRASWFRRS
jgi:hypothetical protein